MSRRTLSLTSISAAMTAANPRAQQLQGLVQEALGNDRLRTIVNKLAEKAEQGDTKSLDYLLTIGGFKPAVPQSVVVNQFVGENSETVRVVVPNQASSPEEKVATYLAAAGEAVPEVIAEQLEMALEDVVHVLDSHPRLFNCKGRVYSLTRLASA